MCSWAGQADGKDSPGAHRPQGRRPWCRRRDQHQRSQRRDQHLRAPHPGWQRPLRHPRVWRPPDRHRSRRPHPAARNRARPCLRSSHRRPQIPNQNHRRRPCPNLDPRLRGPRLGCCRLFCWHPVLSEDQQGQRWGMRWRLPTRGRMRDNAASRSALCPIVDNSSSRILARWLRGTSRDSVEGWDGTGAGYPSGLPNACRHGVTVA